VVILCALVTFFDGYDMNVIGYAAPYLAPLYHLSKPMLGMIFSAGNAGPLVGGFLFGALGDRWGRRPAMILATSIFGVLTLCVAFAHRYEEFLVLRFLNGIALGGAMPLTWALGTEYVPRRLRASIVTLILMGYGLGVVAAGPISVALIPLFGWGSVFVFGGTLSVLAALVLLVALPESLRYLATRQSRPATMARLVNALSPATAAKANSGFVIGDEARPAPETRRLASLFHGELKVITPLLWAAYMASSMTAYFFTILERRPLRNPEHHWTLLSDRRSSTRHRLGGLDGKNRLDRRTADRRVDPRLEPAGQADLRRDGDLPDAVLRLRARDRIDPADSPLAIRVESARTPRAEPAPPPARSAAGCKGRARRATSRSH
jgi:MFS family permease